jgi:CBS domain-containing protein
MHLRDIMSPRVVTIGPTETASAAWTRMRRRNIRHLVVVDDHEIVGILSERDLGGRAGGRLRRGRTVEDLMTRRTTSAEPETTVREAADVMRDRLIGSLPVVDGERVVGIVTATDVFEASPAESTGTSSRTERRLLRAPTSSRRLGGNLARRRRSTRTAGRSGAARIPANIRAFGFDLDEGERAFIRRQIDSKLGKFASSIERVTVRLRDVNGPRGGIDQRCRLKVVLNGRPSVVVQHQAASLRTAITAAFLGGARAVRRTVQRRRTR